MTRRTARERVAQLLCELYLRLAAVGLADGTGCEVPLTQADFTKAAGMTTVHINRALQDLRADGVLRFEKKRREIHDFGALKEVALFDEIYPHQERRAEPPQEQASVPPAAAT